VNGLSGRTSRALEAAGVRELEALAGMKRWEIACLPDIGPGSMKDIARAMERAGLEFKPTRENRRHANARRISEYVTYRDREQMLHRFIRRLTRRIEELEAQLAAERARRA